MFDISSRIPLDECFWLGNTQKFFVGGKFPQSWPWKQNGTTVVAAVMILEVVNNWRRVSQIHILKKIKDFEP